VSTYPTLIDLFPSYRDYSFFVVEDEVVFVDRDRHIIDVVSAGPRERYSGESPGSRGSVAAIDLAPDDIRIVQRVLIERGLLHGEADGVLGPETRQAITLFQRQQGIQVSGSIDARTVSSLGVSGKLSKEANQKIEQSQSSTNGSESSTTGRGQAQTNQAQPSQQNARGQAPNDSAGQANSSSPEQRQQSSKTGQSSSPNQPNTTGQATPMTQSGDNAASSSQSAPSEQTHGSETAPNKPAQNKTQAK
jgi:peptidoglycan hydrolase-like protein with peptidoglycan-binding domain